MPRWLWLGAVLCVGTTAELCWGQTSPPTPALPPGPPMPTIPPGTGPLSSPAAPPPASPGTAIPTAGFPGQVIASSYQFSPPVPTSQTLPRVGAPVGSSLPRPWGTPYDPRRPLDPLRAAGLNTNTLVAPVQGYGDQSFFDRFLDRIKATFGLTSAPINPPPNVTPGIFRRNRQAHRQRLWPLD
jgi:hypothetical protein